MASPVTRRQTSASGSGSRASYPRRPRTCIAGSGFSRSLAKSAAARAASIRTIARLDAHVMKAKSGSMNTAFASSYEVMKPSAGRTRISHSHQAQTGISRAASASSSSVHNLSGPWRAMSCAYFFMSGRLRRNSAKR